MTIKITRNQVSNILQKQREKSTFSAIKSGKDIPYYEDSDIPMIWHNQYSAKDSLRLNKSGLFELKTAFKSFPIPLKKRISS